MYYVRQVGGGGGIGAKSYFLILTGGVGGHKPFCQVQKISKQKLRNI